MMNQTNNAKALELLRASEKKIDSLHGALLFGFDDEKDQVAEFMDEVVEPCSPMASEYYLIAVEHIQIARRHMAMTRLAFEQSLRERKS
tara:strand:+ start:1213 stop:1479 length:267 start_codon:yes stop_codon:yes gene_type:complete